MTNIEFCEANIALILEVGQQMAYPLNDEWAEMMVENLEEWIEDRGDSKEAIDEFIDHFNKQVDEAEMRGLLMDEEDLEDLEQ